MVREAALTEEVKTKLETITGADLLMDALERKM